MAVEYSCCGTEFFIHILIIVFLVLFAGLMSGLTLGLMSLSLVDLEVLAKSGTPTDRKYAAKILPVVRKQHLLLCTLLICNAAAMEALPIFLDSLVTAWGAILISVTLILFFGEIIPQSVCSRYGLAIGATVAPFVRVLVWICSPVAYPISKLLDFLLGHGHVALFRRAELKTLVDLHGNEAGKGGELTHDETTIIAGALELSEKTASDAMTPISDTFAVDINAKLDRDLMNLILEKGHSRVPVYYEQPTNIIGLILAKNLLTIHPEDQVPVKNVTIRRIPRVPETLPLYDILNEFQKGHSHMAVVVRHCVKVGEQAASESPTKMKDLKIDVDGDKPPLEKSLKTKRSLQKWKSFPNSANNSFKGSSRSKKWAKDMYSDILQIDENPLPKLPEEEEAGREDLSICRSSLATSIISGLSSLSFGHSSEKQSFISCTRSGSRNPSVPVTSPSTSNSPEGREIDDEKSNSLATPWKEAMSSSSNGFQFSSTIHELEAHHIWSNGMTSLMVSMMSFHEVEGSTGRRACVVC